MNPGSVSDVLTMKDQKLEELGKKIFFKKLVDLNAAVDRSIDVKTVRVVVLLSVTVDVTYTLRFFPTS